MSVFPDELYQAPRSWRERAYSKLIYYNELDKGGHFAAWEQPQRALLQNGVGDVDNWVLVTATGVSADGTVMVGFGLNPSRQWEAFRAVLPLPQ